jgi:acylglycerol lipase
MPRIEFSRTTPDGQELYYQGWAPEGKPKGVLCLVHGLGEHVGRYGSVAAGLNRAGYALLGFDQRGHGKTPGARGVTPPFHRLMDDIGLLLDEGAKQFPGTPVFLYGHSMGGSWVLNYALRCKPRIAGVISTSPGLRTAFKPPPSKVFIGKVLYRLAPNFVLPNGLELEGISRDEIILNAYKGDPLVHDKMSARLGLDILQQGEWALAHASEFPPIPLLLVHGSCDRITSAPATEEFACKAEAASSQPNVTLKLWPECYHETHNDPEKDQVIEYMIAWLDGVKE